LTTVKSVKKYSVYKQLTYQRFWC